MSRFKAHIAVEGITDEAVIKRLLRHTNIACDLTRGLMGKAALIKQLSKYNEAARFSNWLVVVDLDQDAECAPEFIKEQLPNAAAGMLLRLPVRAVESWLLADREHLARYLGIAVQNVPLNPDLETDPKITLVNLARKCRKKDMREDIVPRPNSGLKTGPGYTGRMLEFVRHREYPWRPEIAAQHSDSLRRCIAALKNWQPVYYHKPD